MPTRRELGRLLLGSPLLWTTAQVAGREPRLHEKGPEPEGRSILPTGELADRIRLTADRLALGPPPLDDLETRGLHLGAIALLPPKGLDLGLPAAEIRRLQRPDGGFGEAGPPPANADDVLERRRLRTNGRLLVGLLEHAEATGEAESLEAAARLGGFVQQALLRASDPRSLELLARADGRLCLTQLAEGLVLLGAASGEGRFFETARSLRPHFGQPAGRSSAEYLGSLRGLLQLAAATADAALRRDLESAYHAFVASPEVTLADGVPEVFGQPGAGDTTAIAELARVSLQLWRANGDATALERAEHLLVNLLFAAQRSDGDFAPTSPPPLPDGLPASRPGSAPRTEWRPLLTAYRTFRDAIDGFARREKETTFVDLFQDADIREPGFLLAVRHESEGPGVSRLMIEILDAAPGYQGLSVRRPSWAASTVVRFDGSRLSPPPGPRVTFQRHWRAGEVLEMTLEHAVGLHTRGGRALPLTALGADTEAVLGVGPWLLAADEATDPGFFSDPGPTGRLVLLPPDLAAATSGDGTSRFVDRTRHLRLRHRPRTGPAPSGDPNPVLTLSPISEGTGRAPARLAMWLRYRRSD